VRDVRTSLACYSESTPPPQPSWLTPRTGVETPVTWACCAFRAGDTVQNLDTTLIEDSIGSATLCADCIVRLTGLPSSRLNDALPRLIGALRVGSILAACGVCLRQKVVHRRVGTRPQGGN
jgi:hypothetical protein